MNERRRDPERWDVRVSSMIVAPPFWMMSIEEFCGEEARTWRKGH